MSLVQDFHLVVQALLATGFTWGVTALGAATVFLTRELSRKGLDWLLGFAAGVMISASYWSLLAPAIEISEEMAVPAWFPPLVGFLLGAAAVLLAQPLLLYALSFAAGAMIFVVVEEVIPESHCSGNTDLATMGTMIGFVVMMVLDVALG